VRAFPIFATLFFVVPLIEIWLLVKVGSVIGALPTILLVIATSILGAYLLRQQGMATLRRFQSTLQSGQLPAKEMLEGMILLVGAILLMIPGFFTDIVGLVCLLPFTRQLVVALFAKRATVYVQGRATSFSQSSSEWGASQTDLRRSNSQGGTDIDGEVVRRKDQDNDGFLR
jgi:UPF0716 protein FxsA